MLFTDLNLHPDLLRAIQGLGYTEPTPVQAHAIPPAILGRDIRACAQTGSGKTVAFALPTLQKLLTQPPVQNPCILIVVPTRELAQQVTLVFKEVGNFTKIRSVAVFGGSDMQRQVSALRAGASIVVATPGRLLDHVKRRTLSLRSIHTLILDEADRMLDMGFLPDIQYIISMCPTKRQTLLFSATFPLEIQKLVAQFLHDPVIIDLSPSLPASTVTQMLYPISKSQKESLLQALLESANISSGLVFCRTKHGADHLASTLRRWGKSVDVIHSNRTQAERNTALEGFRVKRFQILVATDIASRGIDIKDISHVINFDVPQHPEDYVHRIGRTGRAEATGDAFTLVAPDEEPYVKRIEKFIAKTLTRGIIPNFPYLVPPKLLMKPKTMADGFGRIRRRIPTGRGSRFR